jgi:methyl-accepting chemotaxis protein
MKIAIAANQKIAEYLSSVASEFNSASEVIAKGASEQAAGLEETSSSLEEITSMTRNNADNAEQANTLAAQARKAADTGVEAIRQMDTAIQGIRTSADETAKIVKVIDEIAFQTNLLALNAAVEAARAGEAGKGFAVVAEEVRNLAIRSAEAAKDTSGKIELSVKQAQNGVTLASGVSKALDEIATQIGKTAELVQKISHASKEQTQGIEQISTSIAQMDKITQQNASNAEQSASSAQELNSQANQLMDAVNSLVSQIGNISKEAEQMQTKCCA